MKIEEVRTYEDLQRFLKEFTNFDDDPAPYDFNGAFHLFLAILDNLARHHLDADMSGHEEARPWFTDKQLLFSKKLERLS